MREGGGEGWGGKGVTEERGKEGVAKPRYNVQPRGDREAGRGKQRN